jgi:fucose permease
VFVAPLVLGTLVEAPLLALSDRWRRRRPAFVALGLVGVAAGLGVLGVASHVVVVAAAVAVYSAALGVACSVAEGAYVSAGPDPERRLARWTFWSVVGDIVAPLLLGACGLAGLGFDGAVFVTAGLVAVSAVFVVNVDCGEGSDEEDGGDDVGARAALRLVLSNRRLLAWLLGTALCALLDETLAAFTVLSARQRFALAGAGTVMLTAFSVGAAVGALGAERLLRRRPPLQVLAASCAACAACFVAFLAADDVGVAVAGCAGTGLFAAPLFPIAKAQGYRALPGRPGLVNAAETLFVPLDVAAPLLLGLVADRCGLVVALSLLLVQPFGLFALALVELRRRHPRAPDAASAAPETPQRG